MNLKEYLAKHELTQTEFASRVPVNQGLLSQWLSGRRRIAAEHVLNIERATAGNVTRHDLRPDIYPRENNAAA